MNIINRIFLKLVLLPMPVYRKFGINILQLRSILVTKLIMDDRRPGTLYHTQTRKNKPVKAATLITMVLSAVMGLVFLVAFNTGFDYFTKLTIYFSLFFVMLSATLIADFTSVLIDVRDNFIILPKPVNDATVVTARMLHILIHVCKIIVPMGIPGIAYMVSEKGWYGAFLLMVMIALVSVFSIFFINAVYILVLRVTTPQKFQSIISYVQIIFAISIYGSYQVVPAMIGSYELEQLDLQEYGWIIFYPFFWFASSWSVLFDMNGSGLQVLTAVLGLIVPVALLYLVLRYLAPSFNRKLSMMNSVGQEPENAAKPTQQKVKKTGYSEYIAGLVTSTQAEKTGFLLTWKLSSRSRDFKLKVYPGIGYLFVYAIIIFWRSSSESIESLQGDGTGGRVMIISVLYFSTLILTMALNQMIYSDKHKASWLYYTSPVKTPGEIILGAAKSMVVKFYLPLVAIISFAGIILIGVKLIPHILLGMVNVLLIAAVTVLMGNKIFPFSMHQNNNSNTGNFLKNIFILLIAGFIAVIHFLVYEITGVIILFLLLSIIANWMIAGNIRNTSWNSIRTRYAED